MDIKLLESLRGERNLLTDEVKYFLSSAPPDTPAEALLHVAFSRRHVRTLFRESRGEVVPPREVAPGVVVTAEMWQAGRSFGRESPVGLAYSFADMRLLARRRRAWLHAERPERSRVELGFGLLPGEERFFSGLLALHVGGARAEAR